MLIIVVHSTVQNRSDIFLLILQTIIIAQILSVGGEAHQSQHCQKFVMRCVKCQISSHNMYNNERYTQS